MSRKFLLLVFLFTICISGCINSGYRKLGSIVSQVEEPVHTRLIGAEAS